MFPFPLLSGHLILPLPGLQPTQCFPSKYIALVCSVYPPNVNLTSLKEREGEPKSHRNRRHQENIEPNLYIQCQIWIGIEIMLSFMFLSLALLDTFLPFLGSPSRHSLELRPILLSSRTVCVCLWRVFSTLACSYSHHQYTIMCISAYLFI